MVVFGGCGNLARGHDRPLCHNSSFQYNDVWVFDIDSLRWSSQDTTGDGDGDDHPALQEAICVCQCFICVGWG